MVRKIKSNSIYIDANVLINYCTQQPSDYQELKRLFSVQSNSVLHTSNLAIVQAIAKLQTVGRNRPPMPTDEIKKYIKYFYTHIKVYEVKNKDVKEAMDYPGTKDLEDNIHFIVSQRLGCDTILTNNKKDFSQYNITIRVPRKLKYNSK